jgi:hypothetical protein
MADVLKATYADLKTVKTRSTCQVILELPIEALTEVVALLGAPLPGGEVWVAIARLKDAPQIEAEANQEPDTDIGEIDKPPRPLSQVAAILCTIQTFRRFLSERFKRTISGEDEAAALVRDICRVKSRRELDTDTAAASAFRGMRADYRNWMHGIDGAAA